jgi:hypothetical protein
MAQFHVIADCEAEALNGGSWFESSYTLKSASTNLGQINSANNYGIGAALGAGFATSEQVNIANIGTVIA